MVGNDKAAKSRLGLVDLDGFGPYSGDDNTQVIDSTYYETYEIY